ncbi:MAG: universal stress protein UspA related nucleotide-binding protein [halophilic archaeon J07HB67]|nr:MAG: universal stress protein UspA related nucleotide-binding protein [halophilic archaeon J07HB67]
MRVLLGVGGTPDSLTALERTVDRAVEAGDDLTVAVLENADSEPSLDSLRERVGEVLATVSLDATVRRIDGDPGSRLVEVAETEGFDRIVIGGGQTSPMGKINLGETAEFVLLNAPVSVTLVRTP